MAEKIQYTSVSDYKIPNLTLPETRHEIGKYGMMRRTYLKNHRPGLYTAMLVKGTLLQHLENMDKEGTAMAERIVSKMAKANGVGEELKERDPVKWTGLMNNYRHSAEEIVKEMLFD